MKTLKKVILILVMMIVMVTIVTTSKATTVKVTGDVLNIREKASTSSEVIAMISKDVECELLGEEGDFYKVKYKNYTGYISKQYAKKVEDDNNNQNNETSNNNETANENTNLNNNETANEDTNSNNNEAVNNVENTNQTTENTDTESNNTDQLVEKKLNKDTKIRITPLIYSSVLKNAKANSIVTIITQINGWSYVQTDEISGWIRSNILVETDVSDNKDVIGNTDESIGYVSEEYVNMRKGASTSDSIIKVLTLNTKVTILEITGDWAKVKAGSDTGYVSKEFVSDNQKQISRSAEPRTTNTTKTTDSTEKVSNKSDNKVITETENKNISTENKKDNANKSNTTFGKVDGNAVVSYAKKYLGCPYVYGAAGSKSFDCSGFTMYVYKHFGISLPHGATSQSKYGTKVSKNNLQPGDIIFLTDYETGVGIGHCGIYIGNGKFIHASTTGYKVRTSGLDTEYKGRFYSAIRF